MAEENRPAWDQDAAEAMVGAVVLIGITRLHPDGNRQEQMHGVIVSVDSREGFEISLGGARVGETYWLPPDPSCFERARPGQYRLRSTGEVIVDPDYISDWTIEPPQQ
jgi:hypothetical protein